ncbi:hypothetical protein [Streptomyces sp. URMC 129]|uniref:hypothetical protein n=1 Tax=Streptomyces sp. URMC 129 TaxID=3423407 RepID=UPI003F19C024
MTTPAQYIPPEFQRSLGFAAPASNPKEIARQKKIQAEQSAWAGKWHSQVNYYTAKLKTAKGAKAEEYQKRLTAAQKGLAATQARQNAAQGRVYELQGQYDKLLTGASRDAFSALTAMFNSYGLGSLAGKIYEYTKAGYSADTVAILLQDTKEYKTRFAGNEARQKAGLPVLSPAEYLATESAYRQVLADAGLPKGFYDSPTDFEKWIAGDVSPTEIKSRVDDAAALAQSADPAQRQALKQMFGVDEGGIVAYFLDQARAAPVLQRQAEAARIGAAALRRGLLTDRDTFERYVSMGISGAAAEEGFAQVAEALDPMRAIARRFGVEWTQSMGQEEVFEPGGSASNAGRRLRSQERALFASRAGGARAGLSAGYRQT